ncbi:hypothetical protein [Actinomadura rubrisoli]|uniref:Uncharacterized protein n=1 Tax=Actinomadura rubrisoli TaxID=2530368 RepID=A0A4R4ZXB4_9ACTN|nr:hypothetical protein [Actinomadura rubrisoli]TDD63958.1 hypothetical protein E1298_42855 [Actinomadura rubrisoli]
MRFELVVWHEPAPITVENASGTDFDAVPAHTGVAAFADELTRTHPGAEVTVQESRYARVRMASETADEISADVYELAKTHELVCYDPVRRLVHNLGPIGAYEGMQFHTGDGMIVVDPDLRLVQDVLGTLGEENPFAALVVFGRHFVQVSPEDGGYELEYKDSVQGRLYRAHVADLADVRRAFEEYASDDRAFLDRHSWVTVGAGGT